MGLGHPLFFSPSHSFCHSSFFSFSSSFSIVQLWVHSLAVLVTWPFWFLKTQLVTTNLFRFC